MYIKYIILLYITKKNKFYYLLLTFFFICKISLLDKIFFLFLILTSYLKKSIFKNYSQTILTLILLKYGNLRKLHESEIL